MADDELSHVDHDGKLRMVDVSSKEPTRRTARARAVLVTRVRLADLESESRATSLVQEARLVGIQAAKSTSSLVPLCHPLALSDVRVDVRDVADGIAIDTAVVTVGPTGVEMEALAACVYCAMHLLGVIEGIDPSAELNDVAIQEKTGGRSDWGREITASM